MLRLARGLDVLLVMLLLSLFAAGVLAQRRFLASGTVGLQIDDNRAGEAVVAGFRAAFVKLTEKLLLSGEHSLHPPATAPAVPNVQLCLTARPEIFLSGSITRRLCS